MFNKKTISTIIAVSLLLIVTIFAIIGFQGWFTTYQSGVFSDIETKSSKSNIVVEGIYGDLLFLRSDSSDTFSMMKIIDENGIEKCKIEDNLENAESKTRLLLTFDDGVITDLSGYNNNGVGNGGVVYTNNNCLSGGCFDFNGVNGWMEFGSDSSIDIGAEKSWTLSIWFYPREAKTTGLISKVIDVDEKELHLQTGVNHELYISIEKGGNNFWSYTQNDIYDINKWQNIIIKYYNDSVNLRARIYYNGVDITNGTNGGPLEAPTNFNANLNIGRVGGTYNNYYFNGLIDEVAIYSVALKDSEIKALYDARKAKSYEQILGIGIKKINVSQCNLEVGKRYNVVGFTKNNKIDVNLIAR